MRYSQSFPWSIHCHLGSELKRSVYELRTVSFLLSSLIVAVVDRFSVALFSTLQQTHCALASCDCRWVTGFLKHVFEYPPKWCTYSAVWLLHGWSCCHLGAFCVHHTTMSCHFMQSRIRRVLACLAVTCQLHFGQNDQNLLCATAVTG